MRGWSWTYGLGTDGVEVEPSAVDVDPAVPVPAAGGDPAGEVPRQPEAGFPVQADAETWLGESWRQLLVAGVEQAWLRHEGERVYGPIPLRPPL